MRLGTKAIIFSIAVASVARISLAQTADMTPNDPAALERVWQKTIIALPNDPEQTGLRGSHLHLFSKYLPTNTKFPAVVFLHGCNGISANSGQAKILLPALAKAGFAVFAPDSLARPRDSYCDPKTLQSWINRNDILERLAEARATFARISAFPWIDRDNIFLAGHSMGGLSTANYDGTEFRAYAIIGYHCNKGADPRNDGLKIPVEKPVIAVRGEKDEWFANSRNAYAHCGQAMPKRSDMESLIVKGLGHDVFYDEGARTAIIDFFRRHASAPIQPYQAVPVTSHDGQWRVQLACEGVGTAQPFQVQSSLQVHNGHTEWTTRLATGLRGFRAWFMADGSFRAHGNIGRNGYIAAQDSSEPVQWSINLHGRITGSEMTAEGLWGTLPCRLNLHRA